MFKKQDLEGVLEKRKKSSCERLQDFAWIAAFKGWSTRAKPQTQGRAIWKTSLNSRIMSLDINYG